MIEGNEAQGYTLECEICGETVEDLETFQEAVDYKKENEWKSVKIPGGWEDRCPECI